MTNVLRQIEQQLRQHTFRDRRKETAIMAPSHKTTQFHTAGDWAYAAEHGLSTYCNLWGAVTASFLTQRCACGRQKKKKNNVLFKNTKCPWWLFWRPWNTKSTLKVLFLGMSLKLRWHFLKLSDMLRFQISSLPIKRNRWATVDLEGYWKQPWELLCRNNLWKKDEKCRHDIKSMSWL